MYMLKAECEREGEMKKNNCSKLIFISVTKANIYLSYVVGNMLKRSHLVAIINCIFVLMMIFIMSSCRRITSDEQKAKTFF
jgi:hypothetical protein